MGMNDVNRSAKIDKTGTGSGATKKVVLEISWHTDLSWSEAADAKGAAQTSQAAFDSWMANNLPTAVAAQYASRSSDDKSELRWAIQRLDVS